MPRKHCVSALQPRIFALLLAATWMSVGCAGDCPDGAPQIDVFTAAATSVKAGDSVSLTLKVSNFMMDGHDGDGHDHSHDSGCDNSGHAHIYLGAAGENLLTMTMEESFTVVIPADTKPGSYTLVAQLQNNDHKPLSPSVDASVTIEVN